MANFLVVGKLPEKVYISCVNGYRGVERIEINYPSEFFNTSHHIEMMNQEFETLTQSDPFLHDIEFSRKLKDAYNEIYPEEEREIIEIVFEPDKPRYGIELLGFDIADFGYSNILNIILSSYERNKSRRTLGELDLLCNKLKPTLNKNELFNTMTDAKNAQMLIEAILTKENRIALHHKYYPVEVWTVA